MKTKKIPYYLLVGSLTIGASLILGFLSFTGAMALWPIVPVASVFFCFSVAYEGEIYQRNIKGALDKLGFKGNFMHRKLARQYLSEYAPSEPGKTAPLFFQDYMKMLILMDKYKHKGLLNFEDSQRKKALNKSLRKMEKWFALLLFEKKTPANTYEKELVSWLKNHHQSEWLEKAKKRQFYYYLTAIFAGVAGVSMSFGTTYLLLGALSSMPLFMVASPLILTLSITAASLVAGVAYSLLTFNAITDMIDNETFQQWLNKFKRNLIDKPSIRSVLVSVVAMLLFALALALTICTAGTWWTVIKNTPPLFRWMAKIPSSLLMVFPVTNGLAALFFNFQNTAESFEMVDDMLDYPPTTPFTQRFADAFNQLITNETLWQRFNPARLILKLIFTPLRILLFFGHLISIALTSDRLPGVPQILSFLVGLICEGFEDAHYFLGFGKDKHHTQSNAGLLKTHLKEAEGHSHDNDVPTRILYLLFSPMFYLAALWDYHYSATPSWQESCHKFNIPVASEDGAKTEDLVVQSSQHLSKLGMSALESHLQSSLSVTKDKSHTDPSHFNSQKLGFLRDLSSLISEEEAITSMENGM
ncbi:hypothetical protein [Legionella sp. W05-934-2]|uniref:hypothetical protein n=1 Tax=Legionella sp. W05-934-2 TaxID=1198649 RepID=UPI0034618456